MSASAVSASASAASKKGRKASASTSTAAAAPAPAAVAAPAPAAVAAPAPAAAAPAVESTTATTDSVNVVSEFNSLVEQVNTLRSTLSTVFSSMKKLEKAIPRELKRAQKGRRRKASTEGGADKPKKDTVFTKPTPISDALCTFLGVAKGTPLSRSEVTTRVCKYAKDHNLMNKQVIKADAALRKLLNLTEKDELKILNLQRYLKPHYIKPAASA